MLHWVGRILPAVALLLLYHPRSEADSLSYAYDPLGRLIQATDTNKGESVFYSYDAAGNITDQTVLSLTSLAIAGFSPMQGPVGGKVTIYGTGFSSTASSNTVKFNGTAATVTAASSISLTVTVPTGASSGSISVTVGSSAQKSNKSFTVSSNSAPTITAFSPTTAQSQASITITGTNFQTFTAHDKVFINGSAATVTAATTTSLTVTVPDDATSGAIQVITPLGSATSGADLLIPPVLPSGGQIPAASIASRGSTTENGTALSLSVPSSGKYVIGFFPGTQGDLYVRVAIAGDATSAYVLDPAGVEMGYINSGTGYVDLPTLPRSGTYSVVVAGGSVRGSARIYVVKAQILALDLSWANQNFAGSGVLTCQRTGFTFSGTQGESIQLQESTMYTGEGSPAISLVNSAGSTVWIGAAAATVTLGALPASGSYILFADYGCAGGEPYVFYSGPGITLALNGSPALLGVYPNGTSPVVGRASFQATAGQALTIFGSIYNGTAPQGGGITLYENTTSTVLSSFTAGPPFAVYLPSAPATANYFLDIQGAGPTDLQLWSAPTASNILDSSPATVTVPNPGQLSLITFAASTSGYVELNVSMSESGALWIVGPGPLGPSVEPTLNASDPTTAAYALAGLAAGTYYLYYIPEVEVSPGLSNGAYTFAGFGSILDASINVTASSAILQSLSGSGSLSISSSRLGQNARYTNSTSYFETARVLTVNNSSSCAAAVVLHDAGDTSSTSYQQLTGGSYNSSGVYINPSGTTTINFIALYQTGTYTLEFMPAPGCALNFSASIQ